jgi:nickel/cobalt exporter
MVKRFQGLLLRTVGEAGLTAVLWLLMAQTALAHPSTGEPSLIHLLEHEALTPSWVLTGLGLAVVLGAGHALSPGHGKTMAAAYLVGSRSTPWQAVVLGVTTTLTHTLAVFGLGAIALLATQWGWSEQIYPVLSLVSGVMVVAVGSVLLRQRLNALEFVEHHHHYHHHHSHAHPHDHHHSDHHSHAAQPNLIALGIAGGMVPCPSALVLLLSAIALHQTVYGMVLVTAFSLGLALVLVAVGLSVVYSRQWFDRLPIPSTLLQYLPIATAVMIMAVGAVLTAQAIA